MKKFSILSVLALLFLFSCKHEPNKESVNKDSAEGAIAYTSYGEQFSLEKHFTALQTKEQYKDLQRGDTLTISFKAKVNRYVKTRGAG